MQRTTTTNTTTMKKMTTNTTTMKTTTMKTTTMKTTATKTTTMKTMKRKTSTMSTMKRSTTTTTKKNITKTITMMTTNSLRRSKRGEETKALCRRGEGRGDGKMQMLDGFTEGSHPEDAGT